MFFIRFVRFLDLFRRRFIVLKAWVKGLPRQYQPLLLYLVAHDDVAYNDATLFRVVSGYNDATLFRVDDLLSA